MLQKWLDAWKWFPTKWPDFDGIWALRPAFSYWKFQRGYVHEDEDIILQSCGRQHKIGSSFAKPSSLGWVGLVDGQGMLVPYSLWHVPVSLAFQHNHLWGKRNGYERFTFWTWQKDRPNTSVSNFPYNKDGLLLQYWEKRRGNRKQRSS